MGAGVGLWPILLLMFVLSIVVAAWAIRWTTLRIALMCAHIAASVYLIATLGEPWQMWFLVIAPGAIIAATRLAVTVYNLASRRPRRPKE